MTSTLQVVDAANDVIDSIDRDELAKYFSLKRDPEDDEAEVCTYAHSPSFTLLFSIR